jgi:ring-1,2-phenylacetyl-CoA epoxidase subunit PaaC
MGDPARRRHRRERPPHALHPYTAELFETDEVTRRVAAAGLAPAPEALRAEWEGTIATVFDAARLEAPAVRFPATGGRKGLHGEELGHLLAELQYVARAHPGASW